MPPPLRPVTVEVIIVGAGPTGLSMAAQLQRYGVPCLILEKNDYITPLSKAVVVQARTLEIFQELGLAEKAVSIGRVTTALNLFHGGKQKVHIDINGLGSGLSAFPFALSLEQSKTEKLLLDHLTSKKIWLDWQAPVSKIKQADDRIEVDCLSTDGRPQMLSCRYLVGCDGASSMVRHQLNLPFEGDTIPKIFYVADVVLSSTVINQNELYMFMIPKGFVLFFPMEGDGHYRVIGILPEATENESLGFDNIKDSIIKDVDVHLEFKELKWFSSYKVHSRRATQFQSGNCFIAGDAAHIHTPAGGQGMNTGIQDSYNLAWKLAGVIKGTLNRDVLASYNTERVANAEHLLASTDRMFDAMTGSTGILNFMRLHLFPVLAKFFLQFSFTKKNVFPLLSQTGIAYPESYLTVTSHVDNIKAGDRMPYFVLPDGKNIFDLITAPAFKFLIFGKNANQSALQPTNIDVVTILVDVIPESIFGKHNDFYILLRPDNHISYIGADIKVCDEFLVKIGVQ